MPRILSKIYALEISSGGFGDEIQEFGFWRNLGRSSVLAFSVPEAATLPLCVTHVGAQDGVHAGLVAGALGAEPGDDVAVQAEGEEFLGVGVDRDGIAVPALGDVFPVGVGGDGGFQLFLGHGQDAGRVGAAFAAGDHGAGFAAGYDAAGAAVVEPAAWGCAGGDVSAAASGAAVYS